MGAILLVAFIAAPSLNAASCESLASLKLPDTRITTAESVAVGTPVSVPGINAANRQIANLPTFCRVAATLTPSADSDIKIEVWLPTAGWNGKFQGVGNGGWSRFHLLVSVDPSSSASRHVTRQTV